MTEVVKPQLLRAKKSLKGGGEGESASFRTDLSFDELRTALGRAFTGIPGKADGEPFFAWCFSQCHDEELKGETIKFMLSYPISETMAGRKRCNYLDLSVLTKEGVVASTALVVESEGKKKNAIGKIRSGLREFFLLMLLWRKDGIPKLFTSKEWKGVEKNVEGKLNAFVKHLESWHADHGPKGLHWYVQLVGTNPDCNGQGYGAMVLRKLAELADQEKADCYLECDYEKNRGFYAKFGFEEVATKVLEDPENKSDTRTTCLMIRRHR
jgi:ribosomal protein S18 acetylase RimI-like enzyme